MNSISIIPPKSVNSMPLVEAANAANMLDAARTLAGNDFTVIPLSGKKPQIRGWTEMDVPTGDTIMQWFEQGILQNIGIATGQQSGNLVVIDLDGEKAIEMFLGAFPQYEAAYSVNTGSGKGRHIYLYVDHLPKKSATFKSSEGNIEIKADGHQIVVPPSTHPETQKPYQVHNPAPIMCVQDITEIVSWIQNLKSSSQKVATSEMLVNPAVSQHVYEFLINDGFRESASGWLQGTCPNAHNHNNDDGSPSFSYNPKNGVGRCFGCDLRLDLKQMCIHAGVDYQALGGLYQVNETSDFFGVNGKVTHTQIGDWLVQKWDGNLAYFHKQWHRYNNGVWLAENNIDRDIWDVMKQAQPQGYQASAYNLNSVRSYLSSQLFVADNGIDMDDNYLNLQNGLYNLQTYELELHNRDLYLMSQLPFDFDSEAKCPQWEQFIQSILVTPDYQTDEELVMFLQEAMGYTLTSSNEYQVSFWLSGKPASGKSTLTKVLENLLGSAHMALDLGGLSDNKYQLADLANKRCVTCAEVPANSTLFESIYKQLVSGDQIAARQIYQKTQNFSFEGKIWWAMNELPRNRDRSGAVERRVMIIPFYRHFKRDEQDIHLLDKLLGELSGILNWALTGLIRLNENEQFTVSHQSERLIQEYREDSDIEGQFVEAWCNRKDGAKARANELYRAYELWCEQNGHKPRSSTKVSSDWARLGFEKNRDSRGVFYIGIEINQSEIANARNLAT